jgi:hypothetical protein
MPVDEQLRRWKLQSVSHRSIWERQEEARAAEKARADADERQNERVKELARKAEEKQKEERAAQLLKEQKRAEARKALLLQLERLDKED